jgi:GMP synthase (glutamine-hydrolysing)
VLVGGSGHYSAAAENEPWLDRALGGFAELCRSGVPVFASCFGFQAIGRALGGRVIHDKSLAEVGTHEVRLTAEGRADPLFAELGERFDAQMGHTDHVVELPPGAVRLAFTPRANQAFKLAGLPVYCTQFHAELARDDLVDRVRQYPEYIRDTTGITVEEFCASLRETPQVTSLLRRFVELFAPRGGGVV